MPQSPVPEGYHTLTTYLCVDDAAGAIDFYQRAFGATERGRMPGPEGTIAHAELEIGDSVLMLSDPSTQATYKPPKRLGAPSGGVFMYVEDVDALFKQALDAGAKELTAPMDAFWGDRFGTLADPFGHEWQLATRKEDLTPEEVMERGKQAMAGMR